MNTGGTRKLLEQCAASPSWNDFFFSAGKTQEISDGQISFVIFSAHVELWTREIEGVIKSLQEGQEEAGHPLCAWSPESWRAFHDGRLATVEDQMATLLGHVSQQERDATPGMSELQSLIEQVRRLRALTSGKAAA